MQFSAFLEPLDTLANNHSATEM